MSKRTMTEEALFQIQNLEEALNKNAQGILASTMKEEIRSLVKESLNEQEDEEVDDDVDSEEDVVMIDDTEDVVDMGDMDTPPPIPPIDDVEMDDDETIDLRGASDDEVVKVFKLMGDEDGIVVTKDDDSISIVDGEDEYLIKLNEEINNEMENYNELDEMEDSVDWKDIEDELLNMGDNDDDGDDDDYIEDDDEEFELQLEDADSLEDVEYSDEEINETLYELEMEESDFEEDNPTYAGEEEENELEENLYEIELGDENIDEDLYEMDDMEEAYLEEGKKSSFSRKGRTGNGPKFSYKKENVFFKKTPKQKEGKKDMGTGKPRYSWKEEVNMEGFTKKAEFKEGSRTNSSVTSNLTGRRKGGSERNESRIKVRESINNEVNVLREKNEEYRNALNMFRTKLNEVAIFNSNLAYATRLFTEHSTTKQEKLNILRRFDNVETLKESKNLYRVIKNEITDGNSGGSTQITESIERVVSKSPSNGSATNLIESKTYENPQFLRMKDLMTKIK